MEFTILNKPLKINYKKPMETKYFKLKETEPAYSIFYAVSENKTVAVCPDPASPIITCYDNNVIENDIEDIEECSEFDFAIAYNSAKENINDFIIQNYVINLKTK